MANSYKRYEEDTDRNGGCHGSNSPCCNNGHCQINLGGKQRFKQQQLDGNFFTGRDRERIIWFR
jgi:hypothetical protein